MRVAVVIFCLLACLSVAAPLILVQKSVSETNVLQGSELTVTTIAMNLGDDAAYDFNLRDGDVHKDVAVLEPRENVTVTSTIKATNLGNLEIAVATASWATAIGSEERFRATSNEVREEERDEKKHATELGPRGFVNVITSAEYERLHSRYLVESFLYVVLAVVVIGFPFGVYRQKQVQVDFHLKESRKK